jgi:hypothetical protein
MNRRLLRKIAGLTPSEAKFRLIRLFRQRIDSLCPPCRPASLGDILNASLTPEAYKQFWDRKRTFFFTPEDHPRMRDILAGQHPERVQAVIRQADRLLQDKLTVFGRTIACSRGRAWKTDPLTGRTWPDAHWSRIDLIHDHTGIDPKYIWEINRHQFLIQAAMAYWFTGQEASAEFTLESILDWIEHNPCGQGINWVESLEAATRLVAWVWCLELLRGARALSPARLAQVTMAMAAHARHIARFPSHYVSPNTHLTGEAWGLNIFSAVYPELRMAADWRAWAEKVLDEEIQLQVGPDGVHKELSSCYHAYTVEYYLQYVLLSRRQGREPSDAVTARLRNMCAFLQDIQRPDGTVPQLGDGDGGQALPLDPLGWFPGYVLPTLGNLLFKDTMSTKQGQPLWEAIWLCGPDVQKTLSSPAVSAQARSARHYPDANYMVARSNGTDRSSMLVFDAGNMGFMGGGHSHADCLHFDLALQGRPVIVDIGTGSYHHPLWRNYCRGTAAHNTVVIDHQPQAAFGEKFSWRNIPEKGRGMLAQEPQFTLLRGVYQARQDVRHARTLLWWEGRFLVCLDMFSASGPHHYAFHWHFHPDINLARDKDAVLCSADGNPLLALHPLFTEAIQMNLIRGDEQSGLGHFSPDYGQIVPCTTLRIEEQITGPATRAMLLLLPDGSGEQAAIPAFQGEFPRFSFTHGTDRFTLHLPTPGETLHHGKTPLQCRLLLEQERSSGKKTILALEVTKPEQDGTDTQTRPYDLVEDS